MFSDQPVFQWQVKIKTSGAEGRRNFGASASDRNMLNQTSRHLSLLRGWGIEHLPHFCLESGEGKGLLEQGDACVQRAVVTNMVLRVTRHIKHLHARSSRRNLIG